MLSPKHFERHRYLGASEISEGLKWTDKLRGENLGKMMHKVCTVQFIKGVLSL